MSVRRMGNSGNTKLAEEGASVLSEYLTLTVDGQILQQHYLCPLCLVKADAPASSEWSLEHVPARIMGGVGAVVICKQCNSSTGTKLDSQLPKAKNVSQKKINLYPHVKNDHRVILQIGQMAMELPRDGYTRFKLVDPRWHGDKRASALSVAKSALLTLFMKHGYLYGMAAYPCEKIRVDIFADVVQFPWEAVVFYDLKSQDTLLCQFVLENSEGRNFLFIQMGTMGIVLACDEQSSEEWCSVASQGNDKAADWVEKLKVISFCPIESKPMYSSDRDKSKLIGEEGILSQTSKVFLTIDEEEYDWVIEL